MVKNRSQQEINEGVALLEARRLEMQFFREHAHFGKLSKSYFGVENLMSRLTSVLVSRIKEGLPSMRKELSEMRDDTLAKLEAMGKPPPSEPAEMRALVMDVVQGVTGVLRESEMGNYTDPLFKREELRMMARVRADDGPQEGFRKAILDSKPTDAWTVDSLRRQISAMRGCELHGFLNWKVFDLLLKQAVSDWKEPALELLHTVKLIVEEVANDLINELVPDQFPGLRSSIQQIMGDIVDERASKVRSEVVENWLNVENASFTLQSEFLER